MSFQPEWDDILHGYTVKYARQHVWRYKGRLELDDIVDEAFLVFCYCRDRYKYETGSHFMAIYKLALSQHTMDLGRKINRWEMSGGPSSQGDSEAVLEGDDDVEPTSCFLDDYDHAAEVDLILSLTDADPLIQKLLVAAQGQIHSRKRKRKRNGSRETENEALCRMAGVPAQTDLYQKLTDFLGFAPFIPST